MSNQTTTLPTTKWWQDLLVILAIPLMGVGALMGFVAWPFVIGFQASYGSLDKWSKGPEQS